MQLVRDKNVKEARQETLLGAREQYRKRVDEFKALDPSLEERTVLNSLVENITNGKEVTQKVIRLSMAGQDAESVSLFLSTLLPNMDNAFKISDELKNLSESGAKASSQRSESLMVTTRRVITALGFLAVALATLFGMVAIGSKGAFKTATKAFIIVGVTDLCMMFGIALTGHAVIRLFSSTDPSTVASS